MEAAIVIFDESFTGKHFNLAFGNQLADPFSCIDTS
jgi:hypothetical protein